MNRRSRFTGRTPCVWMAALLLAACLAGCGRKEGTCRIALVVKSSQTEYWRLVERGATAFAEQEDIEFEMLGPESEDQVQEQKNIFLECAGQYDAIVLAASDYYLFEEPVEEAAIPVVLIDSSVKGDTGASLVATNNYDAGVELAREFIRRHGTEGKLKVINSVESAASAMERQRGFLEEMERNSQIQVLEPEYCLSDVNKACEIAERTLREEPDVDMIAGLNAQSLLGAAEAVKSQGMGGKIFLGGVDCLVEEIDYIEEDIIDVCILQNPYLIGYRGMEAAWRILQGEKVEKQYWIDTYVIDQETAFERKNQELIFPFE